MTSRRHAEQARNDHFFGALVTLTPLRSNVILRVKELGAFGFSAPGTPTIDKWPPGTEEGTMEGPIIRMHLGPAKTVASARCVAAQRGNLSTHTAFDRTATQGQVDAASISAQSRPWRRAPEGDSDDATDRGGKPTKGVSSADHCCCARKASQGSRGWTTPKVCFRPDPSLRSSYHSWRVRRRTPVIPEWRRDSVDALRAGKYRAWV